MVTQGCRKQFESGTAMYCVVITAIPTLEYSLDTVTYKCGIDIPIGCYGPITSLAILLITVHVGRANICFWSTISRFDRSFSNCLDIIFSPIPKADGAGSLS